MTELDEPLRRRLDALYADGRAHFERFQREVREHSFHPFIPAEYERVVNALLPYRGRVRRFLEWGSATGVITISAALLGFEAYGIEIDADLVAAARRLALRHGADARFAVGSFLPEGYEWRAEGGDPRLGTIEHGPSAYEELGHALDGFDLVYGYPWGGEEPLMIDLMRKRGAPGAHLLINTTQGVKVVSF